MIPNLYLAPFEWVGTGDLHHWRSPGGDALGQIDLRPLSQMGPGPTVNGRGVFAYAGRRTIANSIHLGQDLDRLLDAAERQAIRSQLQLSEDPTSPTVRDLLWDLLGKYADATGTSAPKPLMPTHKRRLELNLGGFSLLRSERFDIGSHPSRRKVLDVIQGDYRRLRNDDIARGRVHFKRVLSALAEKYDAPYRTFIPADLPDEGSLPHRTTLTDDFNRGDSSDLGADWTERGANWEIVSNRLVKVSGSSTATVAHHNTALSSADAYTEFVANLTNIGGHRGPFVRRVDFSAADSDLYVALLWTSGTKYDVFKRVSSSYTSLDSQGQSHSTATDYVVKIQADGSSLKSWFAGTLKSDFTDTALTAIGDTGALGSNTNDDTWDDFEAADVAAAPGELLRPRGMTGGMQQLAGGMVA